MLSQQRCRSWGTLLEKCSSTEAARPPETEAEYVRYLQLKIAEIQLRHLLPLKEDVTDWLNATLESDDITVDNYMSSLDNGIKLCRLARIIVSRASLMPPASVGEAPLTFTFKCWEKATSRSFFARDNVFNFLQFCRQAGCRENFLFETDGLVLHTQPRDVLLCLLELGRRSSRFIVPPCLVQLEQEIEQEQERLAACCRDGSDSGYSDSHEQRERSVERQLLLLRTASEVGRTAADDPAAGAAGGLFKSPRPGSLIPVRRRRADFKKMGSMSVPASATSSPLHHRSTSCLSSTSKYPITLQHITRPLTPSRIPRPSTPATPRSAPPPLNRTRSALQAGDVTDHTTRRLEGLSVTPSGRLAGPSVTSSTGRRDRRRSAVASGEMLSPSKLPTYRRASLYTPRASSAMSDASTVASATQTSPLDEKVQQTFADTQSCCKCQSSCPERKIQLQRLAEGQYMVAGRIVFIRLLKGRHVMVRVGGGWDTLEHFLTRHDPCRATSLPPSLESSSQVGETTEMFLRLPPTPRFRSPQVAVSDT